MVRNLTAFLVALYFARWSFAGVTISESSAPTIDLADHTTYTLTATTDDGSQIVGFDFASRPQYGLFGTMKQVNPAGQATVFTDYSGFCAFFDCQLGQDSHFNFDPRHLTVPSGFASESSSHLRAVFASGTPLGTSVQFVQLVIPNATTTPVSYLGQVTILQGTNYSDVNVAGVVPVPEPAMLSLAAMAVVVQWTMARCRGTVFCRRVKPCGL